jgi:hypothetical protein
MADADIYGDILEELRRIATALEALAVVVSTVVEQGEDVPEFLSEQMKES